MADRAQVWVQVDGVDLLAGLVYVHRRRGAESASFGYDAGYLADPRAYALDPQLPLAAGTFQSSAGLPIFRAFADTSPDRWGRNLITRAERVGARAAGRTARSFGEFDLLLHVRDDLRQGALRFRDADTGRFLATAGTGVPLLTDLPALLAASDRILTDPDDPDVDALRLLLRAGSSLGGARPKAHVLDAAGRTAIAKFPSPTDEWNVMAWEKTAHDLARLAGLIVPETSLHVVDGRAVLIVDRFDRRSGGRRVGYCSALTMLEARDGESGDYLEIADTLEQRSPSATEDLHQLWRRVVFGTLISNTDDHLRNHGFVHTGRDSWGLSPAFDLNPNPAPGPRRRATAVDGDDQIGLDTTIAAATLFRLTPDGARQVLREVHSAVARWRSVASGNGLGAADLRLMEPAFDQLPAAERFLNAPS